MRNEHKYLISRECYTGLLSNLKCFTLEDKNSRDLKSGYRVSSVYFENPSLQSYFDKVDGLGKKFKLRLRDYPLKKGGEYNLEIKHKFFSKCVKIKTTVDEKIYERLINKGKLGNLETGKDSVLENFIAIIKNKYFSPFLRIDYDRMAFFSKCDKNIRITLDSNIKCSRLSGKFFRKPYIYVLPKEFLVLEIKCDNEYPFWLNKILKKYSLKKSSISKYALATKSIANNSVAFVK